MDWYLRTNYFPIIVILVILSSFINNPQICYGARDYELEIDWKFLIETNEIHVEQIVTIYPKSNNYWTYYYQSLYLSLYNITVWDSQTKKELKTEVVTRVGFTNITVYFGRGRYSGYKFVISYNFEPLAPSGNSLFWSFGHGQIVDKKLPQKVTVVLPSNYTFDHATLGRRDSTIQLAVSTFEEEGRIVCQFNGTAPRGGYFQWSIYYKLPPNRIILSVHSPDNESEVSEIVKISASVYMKEGYNLHSLKYMIDNGSWNDLNGEEALWNTSTAPNGIHSITFEAIDNKGSFSRKQVHVNVSNQIPSEPISQKIGAFINQNNSIILYTGTITGIALVSIFAYRRYGTRTRYRIPKPDEKQSYKEYLIKLEKLRSKGRISEEAYRRLRKEYEEKMASSTN